MQKAWAPMHRMPILGVIRAKVADRLGEFAKTSGPHAASRVRTTPSAFFTWLIEEGIAEANPVTGTRKPAKD